MNILEALVKLRDDLKIWSTNNFNKKLNKNLSAEEGGKFLTTNADGDIITTSIAATVDELGYVSGATSNIQTQLNGKAPLNHSHYYAGSSSVGGSANSAVKLDSSAGSETQPVYFSEGKPVATKYTLSKSVPSDAKFTDTNTHYTSKNVVGAADATSNTTTTLTNGNVYINSVENDVVTSSHKISGSGATTVTADTSGNIIVSSSSYTHPTHTAQTGVPSADKNPAFGEYFEVSQPVSNSLGHITAINSRKITIPNAVATTSTAGLMSAEDKAKLDALESLILPAPSEGLVYELSYDKTFYYCSGIGTCTDSVIVFASEYEGLPVTQIGGTTFSGNTNITSIIIPNSITSISSSTFKACTSLTTVTFAKDSKLTQISAEVFRGCSALTSIDIPSNVASIQSSAFYDCAALSNVCFSEESCLTYIAEYAFYNCGTLSDIDLPTGVTTISKYAFTNCTSLKSINIPEGVTYIGGRAFLNCSSLTSIVIPASVSALGAEGSEGGNDGVFWSCTSLTNVKFTDGSKLEKILGYAFRDCSSLVQFEVPPSCKKIGSHAFYGCSNLERIIIPKNVTIIEDNVFVNCPKLSIYCLGTTASLDSNGYGWECGRPVYQNCRDGIEVNARLNNLGLTIGSTEYKIAFGNLDISDASSGEFYINTGLTTLVAITVTPVVYSADSNFNGAAPIVIYESDNSPNVRCRYNNSQTDMKYGAVRWIAIGT